MLIEKIIQNKKKKTKFFLLENMFEKIDFEVLFPKKLCCEHRALMLTVGRLSIANKQPYNFSRFFLNRNSNAHILIIIQSYAVEMAI